MTYSPQLLAAPDLERFLDHLGRRWIENQRERFGPADPASSFPRETFRDRFTLGWSRSVGDPGWQRTWGAFNRDGGIVGHVDLRARHEPSTRHRALMSMALEAPFRRQGLGTVLLSIALTWAEQQEGLAWVDLFHFEQNTAAAALYRKLGFITVSQVPDMFRVSGASVTDVFMTKRLRAVDHGQRG